MAQQGTQCTKRRKGMVSTVLLIIAAFLLLFLPGYLARIFGDDSEGSISTARSRKPGQNTVLAVILEVTMTILESVV